MSAVSQVAVATDNPDAELLELISSFRASRSILRDEWNALTRLPKRHPEYKERWAAFLASSDPDSRLEKRIARTAALTLQGARAKAKLGERCGPDWDQPDAELMALCDKAIAAADESDRLGRATDDMLVSDPRFDPLMAESREAFETFIDLAGRAAEIPATTIAGMRSKAAVASRALPVEGGCNDRSTALAGLLLADVAGRA